MSGPVERNLGGLATSDVDRNPFVAYDFFRIDLESPNGIQRVTNFPQGYVGNIDGTGSQTWRHSHVAPSSMTWSNQKPTDVSWVELWNLDNVWSTILLNYNLEYRPCSLYHAHFNPTTRALLGAPQLWLGRTDKCDVNGGIIRLSLVPDRSSFSVGAPFVMIDPSCQNVFADSFSCQYAGIAKPSSLTAVDGGSGVKGPGTYFYAVTALHGIEETDASTASVTIANSHKVNLSWPLVTGATGYNVYYGTSSTVHNLLLGANVQTNAFTDNSGSPAVGSNVPPVSNGTGLQPSCGHSRQDCSDRGNLIHRVAWDTVLNPAALLWAQRSSS